MDGNSVIPLTPMGQWIEVHYKLKREWKDGDRTKLGRERWPRKFWKEYQFKTSVRVMVCGERVLKDGKMEYPDSYDEGIIFHPDNYFKAFMVVKDMRSKPFFVRAADFQVDPLTGRITHG